MIAVIYRWRIKPGMEEQFADGWARVTRAILQSCGSYGSRLHLVEDGSWLAYARWPDIETRNACEHSETDGKRLMQESVDELFEALIMAVTDDLLSEPTAAT